MDVHFFHPKTEKFINSLDDEMAQRVLQMFNLLEKHGHHLRMPISKPLGDGLFELRIIGETHIRFIYVFTKDGAVIILHGFFKKTRRIAAKDLQLAIKRKNQVDNT